MANSSKVSRRNFMQQSALWAAAFAGGGSLLPGVASAAREKELNIDPFLAPRASLEVQAGLYGVPKSEQCFISGRRDQIIICTH